MSDNYTQAEQDLVNSLSDTRSDEQSATDSIQTNTDDQVAGYVQLAYNALQASNPTLATQDINDAYNAIQSGTFSKAGEDLRVALDAIQTSIPQVQAAILYRGINNYSDSYAPDFGLLYAGSPNSYACSLARTPAALAYCQFSECQQDGSNGTSISQRLPLVGLSYPPYSAYVWSNGSVYCGYTSALRSRL